MTDKKIGSFSVLWKELSFSTKQMVILIVPIICLEVRIEVIIAEIPGLAVISTKSSSISD